GARGGSDRLRLWGARAGSQRRAADPRKVRQGCLASTPAPPGAPFSLRARKKEKGKGAPGTRDAKSPGSVSVGYRLRQSFGGSGDKSVEARPSGEDGGCLTS